ncbi:MAG: hypothetical protein ACRCYZ_00300 [Alphaproteobacteria bacterium]
MYNRLTQKVLLKLAFIVSMTPYLALAGSDSKINQATDETNDPTHAVAAPLATPAGQLSFEMIPSEIIKLILEKLTNPDLQNMRLVEKKLRDLLTQLFTDIKIPSNIPDVGQFKKFLKDLTTVKFWEDKKPSEAFVNLFRHVPIKNLDLTWQQISPEGIKTLGPILPFSLETLNLNHNNIGDKGTKDFAQNLPATLIQLSLSYNNMGSEGAKDLAQHLPATLKRLYLGHNNIGDEGAKALAQRLPSTLTWLYLSANNIGDEGAKALAQRLPSTLTWLHLSANNIGGEGAKALAQHLPSTLTSLYLSANNIGDEGLTALLGAIPSTDLKGLTISVPKTSPLREQFNTLRNRNGALVQVSFR